jgi:hypothetical protein
MQYTLLTGGEFLLYLESVRAAGHEMRKKTDTV